MSEHPVRFPLSWRKDVVLNVHKISDELVEQVKSVARTEAGEEFFLNAAHKQV